MILYQWTCGDAWHTSTPPTLPISFRDIITYTRTNPQVSTSEYELIGPRWIYDFTGLGIVHWSKNRVSCKQLTFWTRPEIATKRLFICLTRSRLSVLTLDVSSSKAGYASFSNVLVWCDIPTSKISGLHFTCCKINRLRASYIGGSQSCVYSRYEKCWYLHKQYQINTPSSRHGLT